MSKPPNPTSKRKPAFEDAELAHCEEGDPCRREILVRADGTVWISALCGEILPVARALVEPSAAEAADKPAMKPVGKHCDNQAPAAH